jgi:two-component system probable response regulator PhcQ
MTQATILYVDDEAMALKYFDRLISPNFKVLTALSVAEGIKVLEAHGSDITVLISDQRMPGGNGNELLRYARNHHPHIVRLLTTAYSELGDAIVAINAGEIYRYITKPWDIDMLRTEVRLAVEVASLRSERDELLHAKIQVQQAQLLANRVNNLALVCGMTQAPALHQFIATAKQLGGVSLAINWNTLHYTDWMQKEAERHARIALDIANWLLHWSSTPSVEQLTTVLGEGASDPQTFTHLLADDSPMPNAQHSAWLAWLIAIHTAGQQSVMVEVNEVGHVQISLTDRQEKPLAHDWLADAMENLEQQSV